MREESKYDSEFWGDTAVSRKGRRKQQEKRRSRAFFWLAVLLVFFAGFMYIGYSVSNSLLDNGRPDGENVGGDVPAVKKGDRMMTVLMVGVDRRNEEASRSDTIMVAFINQDTQEVKILSVPRDTYAKVPGHGNTKINHAHAYGGMDLLTTSVEELLGTDIDRYVEVDFQGFINIIDILDGVETDVEKDMYYEPENINLKKGLQTLNGEDALAYVRYRSDGRGDIGRVGRQQKFLNLLLDQAVEAKTLWKLPELIGELRKNVKSDLTVKDMLLLAKDLNGITSAKLDAATLPGEATYIDELSYWRLDYDAVEKMLDEFRNVKGGTDS
ncbi:LCP family protein [Metallumcola ferriviriculae]|uniref:LCP family protein n=1 Tax=Metallumcola ferriviriculae TaxID=3039180 RepID=A0AAU0UKM3_9FIRM|nr:LCP family protein [Desulfitibacteraceae bacterium MK1]